MTYDPTHRDASWTMFAPGLYIDPAGCGHIFPDEFLAFLQAMHPEAGFDPNSQSDYEMMVATFRQVLKEQVPGFDDFKIIRHTREPAA